MTFTDSNDADLDALANLIQAETGCGYAACNRAATAVLAWVRGRIAAQAEIASVPSAIDALSLAAARRIEDLLVQAHNSAAQRTALIQLAVREAIMRALAPHKRVDET